MRGGAAALSNDRSPRCAFHSMEYLDISMVNIEFTWYSRDMLDRAELPLVRRLLRENRAVAILGARQVGKTTLARQVAERYRGRVTFFDLEKVGDLARLSEPQLALERLTGLVVLDEVQRLPDIFSTLRVLIDRPRGRARFLILGSASPALLRQSSETLAGRIAFVHLEGFDLRELASSDRDRLWLRGGFPRSFLARSDRESSTWRENFVATFLERDLPQLGSRVQAESMRRFWTMLAHYHGQTWNASEFARSFGVSDHTVRRYLDFLACTFMVRVLSPWSENVRKRQVKSPKVYLSDSGLLHVLLGLRTQTDVESHPKLGASFEGFVIRQIIARSGAQPHECFFWGTQGGAELDLLLVRGRRRLGFEVKRTSAPTPTRSIRSALHDLSLSRIDVIYPGSETFPLTREIRAVGIDRVLVDVPKL